MPRKTNKTAHVLNLLSAGNTQEEPETPEKEELPSKVQILDTPASSADPLSDLIKDSLEKEILGEEEPEMPKEEVSLEAPIEEANPADPVSVSEPVAAQPEPVIESVPEPMTVPEPVAVPEPTNVPEEVAVPEPTSVPEAIAVPEPTNAPEAIAVPEPTNAPVTVATPEPTNAPEPLAVPEPTNAPVTVAAPEPDYRYVNVMDYLVEDRLDEFMRKFDTCTCDRCRLDIKAHALSSLSPKYLVTPTASFAPLMSFYANKFQFNIVTDLTKACLAVINEPRH